MARSAGLCLLALFALVDSGQAQINGRIGVQADNDFFAKLNPWNASDHEYTHGTALWAEFPAQETVPRAALRLLGCDPIQRCRARIELGQQIYTPRREADAPLAGERPHAGWLYLSIAAVSDQARKYTSVGLSLGVTGPPSLAAEMQSFIHDVFRMRDPRGWEHQLPAEPTIQLSARLTNALAASQSDDRTALLGYHAGLDVGNAVTRAELGMIGQLCLGADDCGPGGVPASTDLALMIRGVIASQFVARNVFLDGTWQDSHSVASRSLVHRGAASVAIRIHRVIAGYELHKRSREYQTEPGPFSYGSLSLQYIW